MWAASHVALERMASPWPALEARRVAILTLSPSAAKFDADPQAQAIDPTQAVTSSPTSLSMKALARIKTFIVVS